VDPIHRNNHDYLKIIGSALTCQTAPQYLEKNTLSFVIYSYYLYITSLSFSLVDISHIYEKNKYGGTTILYQK
jgi:hypothetical protein